MPSDPRLKDLVGKEKYDSCLAKVKAQLKKKGHPNPESGAHAICTRTFQKQHGLASKGEDLSFSGAFAHLLLSERSTGSLAEHYIQVARIYEVADSEDTAATQQALAALFKAQVQGVKERGGKPAAADVRPVVVALEGKLRQAATTEEESDWSAWWTAQVQEAQKTSPGDQVQWALLSTARSLAARELPTSSWTEAARALLGRIRSMASSTPVQPALAKIANRDARSG